MKLLESVVFRDNDNAKLPDCVYCIFTKELFMEQSRWTHVERIIYVPCYDIVTDFEHLVLQAY